MPRKSTFVPEDIGIPVTHASKNDTQASKKQEYEMHVRVRHAITPAYTLIISDSITLVLPVPYYCFGCDEGFGELSHVDRAGDERDVCPLCGSGLWMRGSSEEKMYLLGGSCG